MSDKPCRNPSCKSHGEPHPNCRCYGGFAKGGEVGDFCSAKRAHDADCEYFAEGGEVAPQFEDMVPLAADEAEVPKFEDMVPLTEDGPAPRFEDMVPVEDYETPGQQALTAVEGAAQGIAGPLAPLMEEGLSKLGVPGITPEDIASREEANPTISGGAKATALIGSMALGVGEAALAAKTAARVAEALNLGKMGSSIVSGALSSGIIQGGDELTKMLLGQSDPNEGVAAHLVNVGGASLLGGIGGGITASAQTAKLGTKITSFLGGLASAADPKSELKAIDMLIKDGHVSQRAFDLGKKAFEYMTAPRRD